VRLGLAPAVIGVALLVTVSTVYVETVSMAEPDTVKTLVYRTEDCTSPLDMAIVFDVSGSMDDDSCSTTGLSHGCSPWWESSTDIFYEDFSAYTVGDGNLDATRLCGASSPWACEEVDRVGARNDSRSLSGGGNYAQTEGWSSGNDGRFYRYLDASPYDQIEIALYQRTYSCDSGSDWIRGWYAPAGPWLTFMDLSCSDTWRRRVYSRDSQAATSFGLELGSYGMEDSDFGLLDNVRVRGVMNGKGPSVSVWCPSANSNCTCVSGSASFPLGCGFDDLAAKYKAQPLWDTVDAAAWFISECRLGSDPTDPPCLDPDLDQIGLAYYSDDGVMTNYYPESGDSTTASELSFDYTAVTNTLWTEFSAAGWTNMGDGIYRGSEILSTNEQEGHHGRNDAVHAMILISDGIPNRPCDAATMNCNVGTNTWSLEHIGDAVNWAIQNGIIIFTISLGSAADQDVMTDIAESTGGTHQYAESTDELGGHLRSIVEQLRCTPPRPDTDGDGLLDEYEYADQCPYWDNPDSDNDGYPDGAEVFQGWDPCDPYDPQTATATSTSTPTATSTSTNTPTATSTSTNTPTATGTSTPTSTSTVWAVGYAPLTMKNY
jgi:hypothetical protein